MSNIRDENPPRNFNFVITLVVILVIIALNSIRSFTLSSFTPSFKPEITATFTQTYIAEQPTIIDTEEESNQTIEIKYNISEIACLENGMIDYAIFNLHISGGKEPYLLQVETMTSEVSGPYPVQINEEPVYLKVYSGESIRVKIWSYGKMEYDWEGIISAPVSDPSCVGTLTPSPVPTLQP